MQSFNQTIATLLAEGYTEVNVEEKLAQDIVLKAIAQSGLKANMTVKGGVVMATLTHDIRRTTMDLDIDFIRYSLADASIDAMVERLNCVEGVTITRVGDIQELKHQDYSGKRILLSLRDIEGFVIQYKLDIGVHVIAEVEQHEMDFDLSHIQSEPAQLLANGPEQVFVEKLKSLLRLGSISSRGKDVFDMAYLSGQIDGSVVRALVDVYIFSDGRMREHRVSDMVERLRSVFSDRGFVAMLASRRMNWLQIQPQMAMDKIISFLESL